ncbi:hypothetical protein HIM_03564 [Hirsutella minnesotensis 3608]|uniref:HTH CENPB-type domain-containing protein n=1 Tax=Hirsutella minnesotensis 3608 TaxID=1043627 RepID=A0A0F7ZVU9_9HYPO|nr:hypothetical protein HIM_03564 [Hirsutella minnesotensis 3608]
MESRTREAVQYIRDVPGAKIASVAREFGIPRNRLRSRLQGHHPKAGRPAANLKLSRPEEAALCRYIDRLDNMNLAVRPGFVTDATNNILRERSGPSGQADFIIGSKWTSRFLKRHGYFKKLQKKLHAERQASEDLTRVTNYFQTLEKVVQDKVNNAFSMPLQTLVVRPADDWFTSQSYSQHVRSCKRNRHLATVFPSA